MRVNMWVSGRGLPAFFVCLFLLAVYSWPACGQDAACPRANDGQSQVTAQAAEGAKGAAVVKEAAPAEAPVEEPAHDTEAVRTASDLIKWEEYDKALDILEKEVAANPSNVSARCQYLIALGKKHRAEDVINQYAVVDAIYSEVTEGSDEAQTRPEVVPIAATEAVAEALVSLRRPLEARRYYERMLAQSPSTSFKAYMGIYTTSTALRDWKTAAETWKKIEELMQSGDLNWMERHEALTARGWLLIGQDRLAEAQKHFESLLMEAGLDSGFRSGLAHVYYYRGWPTLALEQFKIGENVNPEETTNKVGLAQTLLDLDYKVQAASLASQLYSVYPYDMNVRDVYENIRLNGEPQVTGDARFINEAPGTTEWRAMLAATMPITPSFKLFTDVLHMHAYQTLADDRFSTTWDRFGAGASYLVVPGLSVSEELSWDYVKSAQFGSTTKVGWQADDHFKLLAGFESFSLDLPLRAMVAGITGQSGIIDMHYHESDLRGYGLILQSNWFSDGNVNQSAIGRFEQTVLQGDDWRLRIEPEAYYGRYAKSQEAVPYFSPTNEASVVIKPVLHITHYDLYDASLKSSIYADAGFYKEHLFPTYYLIGGFGYIQELKISKTVSLRWTAGYAERVYDGKYTNVFEVGLRVNKYF